MSKLCVDCQKPLPADKWASLRLRCKHCTKHAARRRAYLRGRFKLTVEQYEERLESQEGGCALCGKPPGKRRLAVDHDHNCCSGRESCGQCLRGLLCDYCNLRMQGVDDIDWLQRAVEYRLKYLPPD